MKSGNLFEPHLVVNEIRVPKSTEWLPHFRGWSFIQIQSGIGYWQQPQQPRELSTGSVLVFAGQIQGGLRASQLSDVVIAYFCMEPEKLNGLFSLSEQHSLKRAAAREPLSVRMFEPADPLAVRFANLRLRQTGGSLSTRLQLLQLFIDMFKGELEQEAVYPAQELDSRGRLREFLKETAASEFLNLSLADLAPKMNCSPRHLSRLFREEVGVSFRVKQTELRLGQACQLLATSNAKVIDVALASGYQSNSLFNLMFQKHFGVSPGAWRQRQVKKPAPRRPLNRLLPV